ncbi:uncharacterized protein PG998_006295 [Apiospora kogelbergensis]|uniref:uncharacterized protein n=1 Tax=Apiospora kogelbergensis TaxID=1337665 RepID=UPI00312D05AC
MTRNPNAEKERGGGGRSGSKAVKEFSQVEDFGRDIKVETDADASSSTSGAPAAATAGPPLPPLQPPPPSAPPAAALRPKQPPNSDLPTSSSQHHHHQPQQQQPYSPRQPYEPYYNTFVDDSSNRHIIIHNDDPERPTTVATVPPPPSHQPRLPPFSPRWHTIKRVLTLLSMTWSIVILVLSCLFAVRGGLADGVGLWSLPITIAALLWNSAELATYAIRRATTGLRRGMHPGAHVGGHLLLWLTCALAVYLGASVYSDVLDARRDCNAVAAEFAAAADGVSDAELEGLLRGHCNNNYHYAANLSLYREGFYVPGLQTLLAMFVLATVTHFALFVRACVEVDQRNQLRFDSHAAEYDEYDDDDDDQTAADARYRSRRFSRRGGGRRGAGLSSTAGSSYYDVAVINEEEGRAPMPARTINARPTRDGPEMAQRPKPYA